MTDEKVSEAFDGENYKLGKLGKLGKLSKAREAFQDSAQISSWEAFERDNYKQDCVRLGGNTSLGCGPQNRTNFDS